MTQVGKAERFKGLHERDGAFVIPNPWDVGSARLLEGLGFEALATTSSGFAQSLGRFDGMVSLAEKVEHCRALSAATTVPITADTENCFAHDPATAAATIPKIAAAGVVGASIEDFSGDPDNPIYDFVLAVERVQAAVEAARALDFPFMLTARAENLLRDEGDLDETLRRLQAYEAAGADVLYAPALVSLEEIRVVTSEISRPLNVLAPSLPEASLSELADAGAKRISTGGALARVAIQGLIVAGGQMRDHGSFAWAADAASSADVQSLLSKWV